MDGGCVGAEVEGDSVGGGIGDIEGVADGIGVVGVKGADVGLAVVGGVGCRVGEGYTGDLVGFLVPATTMAPVDSFVDDEYPENELSSKSILSTARFTWPQLV